MIPKKKDLKKHQPRFFFKTTRRIPIKPHKRDTFFKEKRFLKGKGKGPNISKHLSLKDNKEERDLITESSL